MHGRSLWELEWNLGGILQFYFTAELILSYWGGKLYFMVLLQVLLGTDVPQDYCKSSKMYRECDYEWLLALKTKFILTPRGLRWYAFEVRSCWGHTRRELCCCHIPFVSSQQALGMPLLEAGCWIMGLILHSSSYDEIDLSQVPTDGQKINNLRSLNNWD